MKNRSPVIAKGNISMPHSKVGQRRQVVIPKDICDDLGIEAGDYVEVLKINSTIVLKPKKLVSSEDILTPEEERDVREGIEQIRRGQSMTLDQLKDELEI